MRGRLRRALGELAVTIERTATVVAQARSRLAGQMPDGATRLVSLHDPDARPIRKGRIDRPVEFGYKAQVLDNDDGIVLDYSVECGAAPDGPQLAPAIERVRRRAGQVPRAVTADRGYGQAAVERDLHAAGVRTVAIPRQATTSAARKAIEHGRGFRKLVKWRTGCEGRISYLKRGYGWDRTRLDGRHGSCDLVRARGIHPQPGQDRRPCQLTRHGPAAARHQEPDPAPVTTTFSGRSNLALPGRPQNRKRVRPPGSAAKVTIAERGSMRYTFHGGGPCDGALNGAVMPGPLSSGSAGQPLSAHAFAMRSTAPGSVARASRAVRARAHRHLGHTPTASHIPVTQALTCAADAALALRDACRATRPTCCGTDLGTRPLAKQIAQLARRARIALPDSPLPPVPGPHRPRAPGAQARRGRPGQPRDLG